MHSVKTHKADKPPIAQALHMILTNQAPPRRRSVLSRTGLVFVADQTNLEQLQADLTLVHMFSGYCRHQDSQESTRPDLRRLAKTRSNTLLGVRLKTIVMKEQLAPGADELLLSLVEDCLRLHATVGNAAGVA